MWKIDVGIDGKWVNVLLYIILGMTDKQQLRVFSMFYSIICQSTCRRAQRTNVNNKEKNDNGVLELTNLDLGYSTIPRLRSMYCAVM